MYLKILHKLNKQTYYTWDGGGNNSEFSQNQNVVYNILYIPMYILSNN